VDGVTPGVEISEAYIQIQMDRREPGQSSVTSPRKEYDIVHILSGVFEGKITGTPLFIILHNQDMRPAAYDEIQHYFRPGHADFIIFGSTGFVTIGGVDGHLEEKPEWREAPWRASCWRKEEYRCSYSGLS
jgi:chorismate synthase